MRDKILLFLIGLQVFLHASFLPASDLPHLNLRNASIGIGDGLFAMTAFLFFISKFQDKDQIQDHAVSSKVLIGLFIAIGFIGLIVGATSDEIGINLAVREGRSFFLYFLYFPILTFSRNKNSVFRLIVVITIIAILTSLAELVQQFYPHALFFIGGKVRIAQTEGRSVAGVLRVSLPGLSTLALAFLVSLFLITRRFTVLLLFMLLINLFGLVLSFNRGTWASILISIVLCIILLPGVSNRKMLVGYIAAISIGIFLFTLIIHSGLFGERMQKYELAINDRFTSLRLERTDKDESYSGRYLEAKLALGRMSPIELIFGLGLGAFVKPPQWQEPGQDIINRGYLHIGYAYMISKIGLFGLLVFLLFISTCFLRFIGYTKSMEDPFLKSICCATVVFLLSVMIQSFINPRIMEGSWIIIIVFTVALAELCWLTDLKIRDNFKKLGSNRTQDVIAGIIP